MTKYKGFAKKEQVIDSRSMCEAKRRQKLDTARPKTPPEQRLFGDGETDPEKLMQNEKVMAEPAVRELLVGMVSPDRETARVCAVGLRYWGLFAAEHNQRVKDQVGETAKLTI